MLDGNIDESDHTTSAILGTYQAMLSDAIETVGVDSLQAETGLPRSQIDSILAGEDIESLRLSTASLIFAQVDNRNAETIEAEARDRVLIEMANALIDVADLESGLGLDLNARDLEHKIAGDRPMTLREYAHIRGFLGNQA